MCGIFAILNNDRTYTNDIVEHAFKSRATKRTPTIQHYLEEEIY